MKLQRQHLCLPRRHQAPRAVTSSFIMHYVDGGGQTISALSYSGVFVPPPLIWQYPSLIFSSQAAQPTRSGLRATGGAPCSSATVTRCKFWVKNLINPTYNIDQTTTAAFFFLLQPRLSQLSIPFPFFPSILCILQDGFHRPSQRCWSYQYVAVVFDASVCRTRSH